RKIVLLQSHTMQGRAQREIRLRQTGRVLLSQHTALPGCLENAHIVRPGEQRRIAGRLTQHQVLHKKFDINNATWPLLDDEGWLVTLSACLAGEPIAHALTHLQHILPQLLLLTLLPEYLCT